MNANQVAVIDDHRTFPGAYAFRVDRKPNLAAKPAHADDEIFYFGDVTVNISRRKVLRSGEVVQLTRAEYSLLVLFLQNEDRPLGRDAILNAEWGYEFYPLSRTVDAHVARLRANSNRFPRRRGTS